MTCGFTEEIYGLYVLGLLEDEECSQLDVHICRPCENCVAAVRSARATWCAVGASAPDIKPPGGMRDRLLSRYNPHVPWWRIRLPVFGSTAVGAAACAIVALVTWNIGTAYTGRYQTAIAPPAANAIPPTVPVPANAETPLAVQVPTKPADPVAIAFSGPKLLDQSELVRQLQNELDVQKQQTAALESDIQSRTALLEAAQKQRGTLESDLRNASLQTAKSEDLNKKVAVFTNRTRELEQQVTQYRTLLDVERKQSDRTVRLASMASDPSVRIVYLKGSEKSPAATGHALVSGSELAFFVDKLPALPAGRIYQLWALRSTGQGVASAGMFRAEAGKGTLRITNPALLAGMTALAVTDEPEGGSKLPTGQKWMIGL